MNFYMGKDCICGHYRTNHKTVNGEKWVGKCKGQTGCAGHEPCRCKKFRVKITKRLKSESKKK